MWTDSNVHSLPEFRKITSLRNSLTISGQKANNQTPNTKNVLPTPRLLLSNPKHNKQWHFRHWRFVCGIMTGYPCLQLKLTGKCKQYLYRQRQSLQRILLHRITRKLSVLQKTIRRLINKWLKPLKQHCYWLMNKFWLSVQFGHIDEIWLSYTSELSTSFPKRDNSNCQVL